MGYYADLIKEKKEKQNKVVKRGTFKSGNWWISQETAWPNRIVYIAHAEYTSGPYKGEHHGTDSFDSLEKAESYVKRLNSKEEKDNASVQDRFRYKGCMITILKKGENQYTFSVEQNGREEGSNKVYPSQDKAESEAKREVETVWNEAEKDNISDRAIAIAMSYLKDGWKDDKIKKEMMSQYKFSEVETLSALDFAKKSLHNSDEEKGYYAKLAEEKAERNNDKTFSLYGKNYSFGSDRQKNQQEFKKAQDDFNREYFKVKEEMDELQKELKSKRFKLDQQWSTFYSQVKGFLGL